MRIGRHTGLAALLLAVVACGGDAEEAAPSPGDTADSASSAFGGETGPVHFTDRTDLLGLAPDRVMGVAIVDYTGDGWPDITLASMSGLELYRNRGDGTFEPDTVRSGLEGYDETTVIGVVFGDVDDDGDLDLFASRLDDHDLLYANQGDGTFYDVSEAAGVLRRAVSQSATMGDLDGDGDLDIYVATLPWDEGDTAYPPTPEMLDGKNIYWENDGFGRFTDRTDEAGLAGIPQGETFGSLLLDIDGDADLDALVIHDFEPDQLLINDGAGHFTDASAEWLGDSPTGRMGLDVGDLDGDGALDIYATNWWSDLLVTEAGDSTSPRLTDVFAIYVGDGWDNSELTTGWGCAVMDVDNDGDQDVLTISSYTDGLGAAKQEDVSREGQLVLLENTLDSTQTGASPRLINVNDAAGSAMGTLMNGFGLSVGDFDRDGDLDALVGVDESVFIDGQEVVDPLLSRVSLLLRNEGARAAQNASLQLRLRQPGRRNLRAIGARVDVEAGDLRTSRIALAGASYLSAHTEVLHFGLGAASTAFVHVTWPDGTRESFGNLPTGEHLLERTDVCCASPANGCPPTCLSRHSGDFCDVLCAKVLECDPQTLGLPTERAACLNLCAEEPLQAAERACVRDAESCPTVVACIEPSGGER